ncbi:reverse transcriptase domain-containing protein [Tanacetum coccineum]
MFSIKQVHRSENKKADALSKIESTSFAHLSKQVLVEELKEKSINELEVLAVVEEEGNTWMTPIYEYLTEETLSAEVHKPIPRNPQQMLTPITSPWPFYKWEIDIAGPFPEGPGKVKFLMVAIDYFTKWIKAKPEERREQAAIRKEKSKAKLEKYYNSKVRSTSFKPGDLVHRSNDASRMEEVGKLGPKWEGPYEITEALGIGAYKLRDHDRKQLLRTWNVRNLKKCYVHEM